MDLEQDKNSRQNHKLLPTVIFSALVLFGIIGSIIYLRVWQNGDEKAQALSGLLAFIAAIISSTVTIIYVYLTNASLRKAQASIDLQRDQLEQMKSSVDLQQREWEQKVRVFPQFWITVGGEVNWFLPDPQYPNGNRLVPVRFGKGFMLNVWNYSEQSFLVESIHMQRSDIGMLANQQMDNLSMVVKPHSVEVTDISSSIMRLLTQTPLGNKVWNLMTKDLDRHARIFVRLIYSDWSQKHAETKIREFEFMYMEGQTDISISEVVRPSGVRSSI